MRNSGALRIVIWARERPDHTLQTTALVNEAYLRLADQTNPRWQNRAHFFAVAARAMRQILVSYARSQSSAKARRRRGFKIELDEAAIVSPEESKADCRSARGTGEAGHARLKKSSSSRAKIFWRAQLRRDGRSAQDFTCNGEARLGDLPEHGCTTAIARTRTDEMTKLE